MESIAVASKIAVSTSYMNINPWVCEQIILISHCQVTEENLLRVVISVQGLTEWWVIQK